MSRAPKAAAPKRPRAPKGHKLAETFPNGEILRDVVKKQWRLGPVIGQGGFGLLYLASDDLNSAVGNNAAYVVKIEPKANGPLFCELAFYQRCCKPDMVESWLKSHKLRYLGVPKFIGSGNYVYNGKDYRFMVMQRFSTDLQKLFDASRRFPHSTVLCLGLRILDCLEYLHEHEYVHADVKASNILLGYRSGKTVENEVYLVDYGLAFRYIVEGKHKDYKEDPKRVHDGTVEFTSRDAHNGVAPSRRGDLEILGYCLLQWLCGRLPWEDKLTDKNYVKDAKIKYMRNIPSLMKACAAGGEAADAVGHYLSNIVKLDYDEKPNYNSLRQVLHRGLSKLGLKDEWKLNLPDGPVAAPSTKPSAAKARKRKGDDSDVDESVATPKKKTTASKALSNGHQKAAARITSPSASRGRASPAARITSPSTSRGRASPAARIKSPPASRGRASPAGKARTGTPKTVQSPKQTKGATPRSSASPKKTTTRRVRRKKVVAADASIQTTPSLDRKR